MEEYTTRLSLDVDSHVAAGCDESYTDAEIAEAGGLDALIEAYRDHHAERIADIHGLTDSDVFGADPERFVQVTKWDE